MNSSKAPACILRFLSLCLAPGGKKGPKHLIRDRIGVYSQARGLELGGRPGGRGGHPDKPSLSSGEVSFATEAPSRAGQPELAEGGGWGRPFLGLQGLAQPLASAGGRRY